jgi:hypothetical protein
MSAFTVEFTENILDITVPSDQLDVNFTENLLDITVTDDGLDIAFTESSLDVTIGSDLEIEFTENLLNVSYGELVSITNNYGADTVGVTAAENLSGHRIVTVEGYYASKDTASDKFKVLGMTTGAVSSGSEATVQLSGYITEAGWNFTVGEPVFLSTNGHITQTSPTDGFRLIVGKPKTATTLFLELSEPITTA